MNQYTTAKRKIVKKKRDLEATVTRVTNPLGGRAKMGTGKIRDLDSSPALQKNVKNQQEEQGEQRRTKKMGKTFRPLLVYRLC